MPAPAWRRRLFIDRPADLRAFTADLTDATVLAQSLADGPSAAHFVTKKMLDAEWHVSIDQAIDMEAKAQADCMMTKDFTRAYEAFAAKRKPEFQGD